MQTARSTVGLSVDYLLDTGVLAEADGHEGGRGRPSRVLTIGPQSGTTAIFDFKHRRSMVGIADIAGKLLAHETVDIQLAEGAESSIDAGLEAISGLREALATTAGPIHQAVVSVAAPVNRQAGALERSAIPREQSRYPTSIWEEFPVARYVERHLGSPTLVENDANLLALGDARGIGRTGWHLVRLELSTGIGAGIIDEHGAIFRGAGGPAGDLGHIAPGPGIAGPGALDRGPDRTQWPLTKLAKSNALHTAPACHQAPTNQRCLVLHP